MKNTQAKHESNSIILPVLEFVQRHNGQSMTLYSGVVSADQLVEHFHVPEYKTGADTGYQRPVYQSRLNSIASYVINREGVMPTSLLVNIRNGAVYHAQGGPSFGILSIADTTPWYVVDGQHRAKGLKIAKERKQPLPYSLPVVFTIGLSEEEEMDLFFVVNSTQKSVPTDLTLEIIRKRLNRQADSGKAISLVELRKIASSEVARLAALDNQGVWFSKVQLADEVAQRDKPIRMAAFARTIEPMLGSDWAHNYVMAREFAPLYKAFASFWKAIQSLAPAAIDDPKNFSIQSPTGAWVFGLVLKDFVRFADKADDFTPAFFADKLADLQEWVDSATWHKETGEELTRAKGAGVARLIFEKVHPLYTNPA